MASTLRVRRSTPLFSCAKLRSRRILGLLAGLAAAGCAGAPDLPAPWFPAASPLMAGLPVQDLDLQLWGPVLPASLSRAVQSPGISASPLASAPDEGPPPEPPDARRYSLLPGVDLAPFVEHKVDAIAELYFRKTGKDLIVTSGTRDPERQAEAMHELFRLGADVLRLYKDKEAVREIKRAYDEGLSTRQPAASSVAAIAQVIRAQVERGVFISAHLREGAVDIRNREMTATEKRAFIEGLEEVGGVMALEESRPPHYHLQIE
jgi:hypothetical protein